MRITIRDVAKLAGVSPSTVSRVLNGKNYVDEEKRACVMKAVADLSFVPNASARSLGKQKADAIGILAMRGTQQAFSNPFFPDVIMGISSFTDANDILTVLINYENIDREIDACLRLAKSGKVDGFILLSSRVHDDLIVELMKNQIKFVLIGRVMENAIPDYDEVYYINTDNIKSSSESVQHLVESGAKKIGIVLAPQKYVVSQDRYFGYRQALMKANIRFEERLCVDGGYTLSEAKRSVDELLDQSPDLDAIFATDDMKAVAAILALKERGLSVPDDIMVMGHGDFEIAQMVEPMLSTVHVPVFELGRQSAQMLLSLVNDEPIERSRILDTSLVVRKSTAQQKENDHEHDANA